MKKFILISFISALVSLLFTSCTVYIARPYVDYSDDPVRVSNVAAPGYVTRVDDNYGYATGNGNVYYNTVAGFGDDYMVLRIYDNRYVFYQGNDPVAVWIFMNNGTIIKRGRVINGLVKMFYGPYSPAAEMIYRDDRRDGEYRVYYRSGKLMESGNYAAGARSGEWRKYNNDGNIYEDYEYTGNGVSYKQKAKGRSSPEKNWDWSYVEKEDRYANTSREEFSKEDIVPKTSARKFGDNPFEAAAKESAGNGHGAEDGAKARNEAGHEGMIKARADDGAKAPDRPAEHKEGQAAPQSTATAEPAPVQENSAIQPAAEPAKDNNVSPGRGHRGARNENAVPETGATP